MKSLPYRGKKIKVYSKLEHGSSVNHLDFDVVDLFFPLLENIHIKSEKPTELKIFLPDFAKKLLKFESEKKEVDLSKKIVFQGEFKLTITASKSKGKLLGVIPVLYFLKTEEEAFMWGVPIPIFVESTKSGWEFPLYHYLHPKAENYLLPLLAKEYSKEHSEIFNLLFPYSKKFVKHGDKYFTDGIFYWILNAREGERKTYLYNFTAEPVTFKLFTPSGIKEVEVLGDSREYYELPEDLQFVVAIGENRMEWFPV